MEYSIVIPAYNESDKITSTLTQIISFMKDFSQEYEVIVVDDGSTDNTSIIVDEYSLGIPEIKLIKNNHKGKGHTIWTGINAAQGEYIYMCDADLATPISEIKKMLVWLNEHDFDIVIASRQGLGAKRIDEPFYRHFIGRAFNLWVQLFALKGISDSQCGFKLFKKHAAKEIFGRLSIYGENAKETNKPFFGAFDVEVLFIARKLGFKIKELPVEWHHIKTKNFDFFNNSYKMALDVLKVRINELKGVYR